jgi:hypothetical protein
MTASRLAMATAPEPVRNHAEPTSRWTGPGPNRLATAAAMTSAEASRGPPRRRMFVSRTYFRTSLRTSRSPRLWSTTR